MIKVIGFHPQPIRIIEQLRVHIRHNAYKYGRSSHIVNFIVLKCKLESTIRNLLIVTPPFYKAQYNASPIMVGSIIILYFTWPNSFITLFIYLLIWSVIWGQSGLISAHSCVQDMNFAKWAWNTRWNPWAHVQYKKEHLSNLLYVPIPQGINNIWTILMLTDGIIQI